MFKLKFPQINVPFIDHFHCFFTKITHIGHPKPNRITTLK